MTGFKARVKREFRKRKPAFKKAQVGAKKIVRFGRKHGTRINDNLKAYLRRQDREMAQFKTSQL